MLSVFVTDAYDVGEILDICDLVTCVGSMRSKTSLKSVLAMRSVMLIMRTILQS
jgi:hypothetical protein